MNVSSRLCGMGLLALLLTHRAAAAAAADPHVVMYSANDDTVNTMVSTAFTKATGIKVDVISAGSGLLYRRIAAEKAKIEAELAKLKPGVEADALRGQLRQLDTTARLSDWLSSPGLKAPRRD